MTLLMVWLGLTFGGVLSKLFGWSRGDAWIERSFFQAIAFISAYLALSL